VEPHIDGTNVEYLGSVGPDQRAGVLGHALALLHLISFDEPFTPVIAFDRGSMPEIIRDGETGYVVEDIEGAINAVAAVRTIDRAICRADVEKRFTSTRMARDYVRVYREILNGDAIQSSPSRTSPTPWRRFTTQGQPGLTANTSCYSARTYVMDDRLSVSHGA
jgi:hypothetical protein